MAGRAGTIESRRAPATVLVVDPQHGPSESLRMILAPRHAVRMAGSAAEARRELRRGAIDVLTLEPRLLDAEGPRLVRSLRREFPDVELILVSTEARFDVAVEGMRWGIVDYLIKPFDVVQVNSALRRALARRDERRSRERSAHRQAAAAQACLGRLLQEVESRDPALLGHGERVAHWVDLLADQIGLEPHRRQALGLAARVHDLGKIGVARAVLVKTQPLTPLERSELERHPELGAHLLEAFAVDATAVAAVRHHHEWWNGCGYPTGLRGEAIPLGARLVQLADAFDAMVSDRCYRGARPQHDAAAELARRSGSQFDPTLVKEFLLLLQSGAADRDSNLLSDSLAFAERVDESAVPST